MTTKPVPQEIPEGIHWTEEKKFILRPKKEQTMPEYTGRRGETTIWNQQSERNQQNPSVSLNINGFNSSVRRHR